VKFVTENDPEGGIAAFGSPTIVHFAIALILSCLLCAPWSSVNSLRLVLLALGIAALLYAVVMLGRTLRQKTYAVTTYDWSWYVVLPAVAYVIFTLSAVLFDRKQDLALDGIAIATLMLICIGIHNAWDTVTYLTIMAVRKDRDGNAPIPASHGQPNRRKHARRR
jgi:hypothetical protein